MRFSPDPELLRLGAGQLFIDIWDDDGLSTGFFHAGNLTSLEITLTPDVIIKRSTMTRSRPVYKKLIRSIDTVVRAVPDEWSVDWLSIFLLGDLAYTTQPVTAVVDQILMANVATGTLGSVLGGQVFAVGKYNIGSVTMDLGATPLTADDFEVLSGRYGLVRIKATSTQATNGADDLTVSYTPVAITGQAAPSIRISTTPDRGCSMLFIEDNTLGENHIFRAFSASPTPDGTLGFISDDFASMAVNFTLQDDSAGLHGGSVANPLADLTLVPEV